MDRTPTTLSIRTHDVRWLLLLWEVPLAVIVLLPICFMIRLLTVYFGDEAFFIGLGLAILAATLAVLSHASSRVRIHVARGGLLTARDGWGLPRRVLVPSNEVVQVFGIEYSWFEGRRKHRHDRRAPEGARIRGVKLIAQTRDGRDHVLADGVLGPANARVIEAEVEAFLGIKNKKMVGEIAGA